MPDFLGDIDFAADISVLFLSEADPCLPHAGAAYGHAAAISWKLHRNRQRPLTRACGWSSLVHETARLLDQRCSAQPAGTQIALSVRSEWGGAVAEKLTHRTVASTAYLRVAGEAAYTRIQALLPEMALRMFQITELTASSVAPLYCCKADDIFLFNNAHLAEFSGQNCAVLRVLAQECPMLGDVHIEGPVESLDTCTVAAPEAVACFPPDRVSNQYPGPMRLETAANGDPVILHGFQPGAYICDLDNTLLHTIPATTAPVERVQLLKSGRFITQNTNEEYQLWSADGSLCANLNEAAPDPYYSIRKCLELPDGSVLTWGYEQTIRHFSPDGVFLQEVYTHKRPINDVVLRPDGCIVSCSDDTNLVLWDYRSNSRIVMKAHDDPILDITILDDMRILSWDLDCTVYCWQPDGKTAVKFSCSSDIYGIHQLENGRFVTDSADGLLRVWSADCKLLQVLSPQEHTPGRIYPLSGGGFLVSGNEYAAEYTICFYDDDGQCIHKSCVHSQKVNDVYDPGDGTVYTYGADGFICRWNNTGNLLARRHTAHRSVQHVTPLADGTLLSLGSDTVLYIWSAHLEPVADAPALVCGTARINMWVNE